MKRILMFVVAGMLTIQTQGLVFAMDDVDMGGKKDIGQSMEKMQEKHLDKMTKDLDLTPEQREKVSAIMKENNEARKAEMQKRMEAAKARESTDAKIKAVLTPDQIQKFDAMRAERKEKMGKKMKKMHKNMGSM